MVHQHGPPPFDVSMYMPKFKACAVLTVSMFAISAFAGVLVAQDEFLRGAPVVLTLAGALIIYGVSAPPVLASVCGVSLVSKGLLYGLP